MEVTAGKHCNSTEPEGLATRVVHRCHPYNVAQRCSVNMCRCGQQQNALSLQNHAFESHCVLVTLPPPPLSLSYILDHGVKPICIYFNILSLFSYHFFIVKIHHHLPFLRAKV